MDAKKLIEAITKAFEDAGFPIFTKQSNFLQWLNGNFFEIHHEIKPFLDDHVSKKCTEISWGVASMQISLGDFLILTEPEDELTYMLLLHRMNTLYEQIYRLWERYTGLLYYLFFKKESKNRLYFNNLIEELSFYKKNIVNYKKLAKYVGHWNSLASKRNELSHESSSLTAYTDFTPIISPIVDQFGYPFTYIKLSCAVAAQFMLQVIEISFHSTIRKV